MLARRVDKIPLFEPQSEYGQRDLFADEVPDNQKQIWLNGSGFPLRSDGIDAKPPSTGLNSEPAWMIRDRVKLEPGAVSRLRRRLRSRQDAALATRFIVRAR